MKKELPALLLGLFSVLLALFFLLLAPLPALAAMNLRVDAISVSSNAVSAGGTTQFTATVTNIGDQLTAAIVRVYLSSDAALTEADDQPLTSAPSPLPRPADGGGGDADGDAACGHGERKLFSWDDHHRLVRRRQSIRQRRGARHLG